MESSKELYHDEVKKLKDFRARLEAHAIYKDELDEFTDDYEELIAQAKVITRVSDRLQKKLDSANLQIRGQNEEIKLKNLELEKTIKQLAEARVGRKASTVMLTVAIVLFVSEEFFLEEIIEQYVSIAYLDLFIKGGIALILKFLESGLEGYFMKQEKKKIMKTEKNEKLQTALAN